ncbi:hypothetical protein BCIN_08g05280 [Neofusicoccum parvum]|nr:hypothetical protein BCIN_08g05280 [Neofusicoccum parvum]
MLTSFLTCALLLGSTSALPRTTNTTTKTPLRVETFISHGASLDMVSSLIVGSEAAMVIDLPLTISSAKDLAAWVKTKTDKPVVSAFTSHNHPDHYLGARVFLEAFPNATYYASPKAVDGITIEAAEKSAYWAPIIGPSEIVSNASIPTPYNFSILALPGDASQPIQLIQPLVGDTIDETLFWLPTTRTLIAGDSVYSHTHHPFMADMLTPALTASWLSTLDLLADLDPAVVVPGHALYNESFAGTQNLEYTREYLAFWQTEVEAKGADYYTPEELYELLDARFPGKHSANSEQLLNITVENFGRGGSRFAHFQDLTVYTDEDKLEGWEL